MKREDHKKGVLITIIVLLVIFLPLSVLSYALHKMDENNNEKKHEENPSHELYYQGKLYFYDKDENLLGTYTCQNDELHCKIASNTIDDEIYALDYYQDENLDLNIIKDRYVFLNDSMAEIAPIILYDIKRNRTMATYNSVKNYGIGIEGSLFIIGDRDFNYGVLSLETDPIITIPFDYSFLGIANLLNEDENKIMNDLFVGKKDEQWYLLDPNGAVLTEPIEKEIVSYNGQSIITKDINGYSLVDYNNQNILENTRYNNLSFTGKYLNILDTNNDFYIYDIINKRNISNPIHVMSTDQVTSRINQNGMLEIIRNNEVVQTLSISQ